MKFLELFSEANGQLSSVRAQTWLIMLCFCGDYVMHIVRSVPFSPDLTVAGMVIAILGLKVAQKRLEDKKPPEPPTTDKP